MGIGSLVVPALIALSGVTLAAGDLTRGLHLAKRAVAEAPADPRARVALGVAFAAAGELSEARREMTEATRLEPSLGDPEALLEQLTR